MPIAHEQISVVIDGRSIVNAYAKRRLLYDLVIRHPQDRIWLAANVTIGQSNFVDGYVNDDTMKFRLYFASRLPGAAFASLIPASRMGLIRRREAGLAASRTPNFGSPRRTFHSYPARAEARRCLIARFARQSTERGLVDAVIA